MTHNIYALKEKYIEDARKRNLSELSIIRINKDLNFFFRFLQQRYPSILDVRDIKREMILEYRDYIEKYKRRNGKSLVKGTKYGLINILSLFFRFLEKSDYIFLNPALDLKVEKVGRNLPKTILTEEEVKRLLKTPNLKTPSGIRGRAILELFYGSGIRLGELIKLRLSDLDLQRSYLFITGKGGKDRVVPITRPARYYLKKYIEKVRPILLLKNPGKAPKEETLFLSHFGNPFDETTIDFMVHKYGVQAKLQNPVTPHILRHTCASHLIARGASVRYVQELLGHSTVSTTQIYTRVMPVNLKEIYLKTHPRCIHTAGKSSP